MLGLLGGLCCLPLMPVLGSSLWLARAQAPAGIQVLAEGLGPRFRGDEWRARRCSRHHPVELAIDLGDDLVEALGQPGLAVARAGQVDLEAAVDAAGPRAHQ